MDDNAEVLTRLTDLGKALDQHASVKAMRREEIEAFLKTADSGLRKAAGQISMFLHGWDASADRNERYAQLVAKSSGRRPVFIGFSAVEGVGGIIPRWWVSDAPHRGRDLPSDAEDFGVRGKPAAGLAPSDISSAATDRFINEMALRLDEDAV